MCVGIPMKILSVDGIAAIATDGTREELIDLSLRALLNPGEPQTPAPPPALLTSLAESIKTQ